MPVEFFRTSSTTITQLDATTTQVVYSIAGSEFAHTFSVLGLQPVPPFVIDPGASYLYEGRQGLLRVAVVNEVGPYAPAIVTGSIAADTTLAHLLFNPLVLTNVRFPFAFATGDYTVTVTCAAE